MISPINNSNPIEQNLQKAETEKNKNPSNYWKEKAVKVTVFILSASLMAGVLMTDVVFNIKEMMSNFIFPVDINALEIKLNKKFSPEFMAKIKGNKDLNTQYVFKRLIKANPDTSFSLKRFDSFLGFFCLILK